MKKIFIGIVCLISFCGLNKVAIAQTVYPNFVDGRMYFNFEDSYELDFFVDADHKINIAEFPFLVQLAEEFGITNVMRPFYIFDTPKMKRIVEIEFDSISKVDLLQKKLETYDFIKTVSKKGLDKIFLGPNDKDTYYDTNYNGYNFRWHLDMINAEKAWNITRGNSKVKIAIVDNSVWGEHPDLQIPGNLQYNVRMNKVGNSAPPDTIPQNTSVSSSDWSHGTHCAGLVGGITNNSLGVASIGGGVTLMGVNASNNSISGVAEGPAGAQWAFANGANIISMSYGSTSNEDPFKAAVYNALADSAVILIAAAGNDGVESVTYPAGYNGIISVGSVDSDGKLSSFSQYGNWVNVAAPGGYYKPDLYGKTLKRAVLSTTYSTSEYLPGVVSGYYDVKAGSSMATPIVAGLCGLMLSKNPHLTTDKILYYLQSTAIPINSSSTHKIATNSGYINAEAALKAACDSLPTAGFKADIISGVAPLKVHYTDTSSLGNTGTQKDKKWYFSGGTTLLQDTVLYENPGIYDVALVVTNNFETVDKKGQRFFNTDSLVKKNYINVRLLGGIDTVYANIDTVTIGSYINNNQAFNIISSNQEWEIINNASWASYKIDSLDKLGNAVFTVYATDQNPLAETRMAEFKVIRAGDTAKVVIKQAAANEILKVDKMVLKPGRNVQNNSIDIKSTLNWEFVVSEFPEWISVNPASGSGDAIGFNIKTEVNETFYTRQFTIKLKGGALEKQITVIQTAKTCNQSLDKDSLKFEKEAGISDVVKITTSCQWTIANPIPSFVTISPTSGDGDTTITVTTKTSNLGGTKRSGVIKFSHPENVNGTLGSVVVIQNSNVGIDEGVVSEINGLKIYPNPVSRILVIEGANSFVKTYQLLDISGRIFSENKASAKTEIDMQKLSTGSYLLKIITTDGTQYIKKIVKE